MFEHTYITVIEVSFHHQHKKHDSVWNIILTLKIAQKESPAVGRKTDKQYVHWGCSSQLEQYRTYISDGRGID